MFIKEKKNFNFSFTATKCFFQTIKRFKSSKAKQELFVKWCLKLFPTNKNGSSCETGNKYHKGI